MMRREIQRLDHARGEKGLGQRLAAAQRQRQMPARQILVAMGHENLARHGFERAQHVDVLNAARAHGEEESRLGLRQSGGFVGGGGLPIRGHEARLERDEEKRKHFSARMPLQFIGMDRAICVQVAST